jgi:pimeloyl-ACP methyl ester carboxylesterase
VNSLSHEVLGPTNGFQLLECNPTVSTNPTRWLGQRTPALGTVVLGAISVRHIVRVQKTRADQHWHAPSGVVTLGTLNVRRKGLAGPPVILLHGMCGSHQYWGADFDILSESNQLIVPDLLGFGTSPKPPSGYGPVEHAEAIAACLNESNIEQPAVVVGHSMGALVALASMEIHPELVDSVMCIAPPIYETRTDARRHVRAMGTLTRLLSSDPPAHILCKWMCAHRELARRLAPLLRPEVPAPIARDAVDHTWYSYGQSMEHLILSTESAARVKAANRPVELMAALDDGVPDIALLNALREANPLVSLTLLADGGHDLPLTRSQRCIELIQRRLDARPSA